MIEMVFLPVDGTETLNQAARDGKTAGQIPIFRLDIKVQLELGRRRP
jgi:hypothetical protein